MALRRCPYCKAIIDESSEYCSNCGTQLLFPEDEYIEEEIPGEKIVDDEPEEESEEEEVEENPEQKKRKRAKKAPTPEEEESEIIEEESSDEEEPSVEEALEKGKLEPPHMAPTDTEEYEKIEPTDRISEEEEEKEKEEKSQKELTFKTEELEKAIDTTEMEKREIERFLNSIKKDREEKKEEERKPETDEELPPWAAQMKEIPPEEETSTAKDESREGVFEAEEIDSFSEHGQSEGETPAFDSGIGIPEEEPQKSIPFDQVSREERQRMRIKPHSGMALWLKSRAFDIFFIGILWLIAIWVASRVMGVSLFQLISAAALTVVIFYGILLVCYYFLFLLFLGETLGDHLFSE